MSNSVDFYGVTSFIRLGCAADGAEQLNDQERIRLSDEPLIDGIEFSNVQYLPTLTRMSQAGKIKFSVCYGSPVLRVTGATKTEVEKLAASGELDEPAMNQAVVEALDLLDSDMEKIAFLSSGDWYDGPVFVAHSVVDGRRRRRPANNTPPAADLMYQFIPDPDISDELGKQYSNASLAVLRYFMPRLPLMLFSSPTLEFDLDKLSGRLRSHCEDLFHENDGIFEALRDAAGVITGYRVREQRHTGFYLFGQEAKELDRAATLVGQQVLPAMRDKVPIALKPVRSREECLSAHGRSWLGLATGAVGGHVGL